MTQGTKSKLSGTARGYGYQHQRRRQQAISRMTPGQPCTRCGAPIQPTDNLHLDHTDDRRGYLGLAHARCNVTAGAKRGAAARTQRRVAPWRSRAW
jgi:hypothetical protein